MSTKKPVQKHVIDKQADNRVLFIHTKCEAKYQDYYMADMINSLAHKGSYIVLCTTCIEDDSPLNYPKNPNDHVKILCPWGKLHVLLRTQLTENMVRKQQIRNFVFKVISDRLTPRPSLIITDAHPSTVTLLKTYTSYRVVYIKHFPDIYCGDVFYPLMRVNFERMTTRALRQADVIVCQTQCLKRIILRSLPICMHKVAVLHQCCSLGRWLSSPYYVWDIIPTLPYDAILFVVFVEFKPRSNIELILQALKLFGKYRDSIFFRTRVVFAGISDHLSAKERIYYNDLVCATEFSVYRHTAIFIMQTDILVQKTLILKSTALLNPTNHNVYQGGITMAMKFKKPIVSVCSGFAASVLQNNVTGFLIANNPEIFLNTMRELAMNSEFSKDIVENAKKDYTEIYGQAPFQRGIDFLFTTQIADKKRKGF